MSHISRYVRCMMLHVRLRRHSHTSACAISIYGCGLFVVVARNYGALRISLDSARLERRQTWTSVVCDASSWVISKENLQKRIKMLYLSCRVTQQQQICLSFMSMRLHRLVKFP